MRAWKYLLLGLWSFCALFASPAPQFNPEKDIKLSLEKGHIVVGVPQHVHIKKSFVSAQLVSKPGTLNVGPLPDTKVKDELDEEIYPGTFRIPIKGKDLTGMVKIEVSYQPCTEGEGGSCYPPTSQVMTVKASDIPGATVAQPAETPKATAATAEPTKLEADPQEKAAPAAKEGEKTAEKAPEKKEENTGAFWLLLTAFGAGLATSLTPCVYPMIPITMAILGAKGGGMLKGFLLSVALVLGMAVTYTILGVAAARAGSTFGSFAQSPYFLIPVSIIFTAMAFSLFGAFEIQLPQSLQSKLQGEGPRKGYGGAFITGMVLGPLAAPCAGPFVVSLLFEIGKRGNVALGGLAFFIFALGMGVLFLVVGTFSAGLPRSGNWLTRLKYIMGAVIVGFAVWNVRLVIPEWSSYGFWALVMFLAAAIFGAFEAAEDLTARFLKALAIFFLAVGLLLGIRSVELGLDLNLLPKGGAIAEKKEAHAGAELWFTHEYEKAQEKAKADGKLVLVDTFSAWCAACKELDHKTWPDPEVVEWLKQNAVPVRIDTEAVRKDLKDTLGIQAYPTIILLKPDGTELRRTTGFLPPKKMIKFLEGK